MKSLKIPLSEVSLVLIILSRSPRLPDEVELLRAHLPKLAWLNTKMTDCNLQVFRPIDIRYVWCSSSAPSSGPSKFFDLVS